MHRKNKGRMSELESLIFMLLDMNATFGKGGPRIRRRGEERTDDGVGTPLRSDHS